MRYTPRSERLQARVAAYEREKKQLRSKRDEQVAALERLRCAARQTILQEEGRVDRGEATIDAIRAAVAGALDILRSCDEEEVASRRHYDEGISAALRAGSPGPRLGREE